METARHGQQAASRVGGPAPTGEGPRPSIAVCLLTFRRPEGLRRLLEGIAALDPVPDAEVRVVVVDNDPHGSAGATVDRLRPALPWPMDYVVEPRQGIPFGRNRALATAAGADFVAFLDDDEVPAAGWLAELVRVQRVTAAAVVTGPVLRSFEEPPPSWVVEGGFFDKPRFATGSRMEWATTSSVLMASTVYEGRDRPFNEAMALHGGDDTHFFWRARRDGHLMVWADDAVVVETVPGSRVTARWLVGREYRRGNTIGLCGREFEGWGRRARQLARGLVSVGQGAVSAIALARRGGRAARVDAARRVAFGFGLLAGGVGLQYDEYRRVHGR